MREEWRAATVGAHVSESHYGIGGRTSLLTRLWPGNPLTHRNLVNAMAAEARRVDWVTGAFMFIRRRTYDDVGGFDERFFMYWEDADLCRRAATVGWDTAFLPAVGVLHLTGRASRHVPIRIWWPFTAAFFITIGSMAAWSHARCLLLSRWACSFGSSCASPLRFAGRSFPARPE